MPSMRQLTYFIKIASGATVTKTAEEMFVSQTAVSNALTRLEEELGTSLFQRKGRTLILNEYGIAFRHHAENILSDLENAIHIIDFIKNQKQNSISIALSSSILWGELIGIFLNKYPDSMIIQKECNYKSITSMLPNLDVDFIIAGEDDFSTHYLDKYTFCEDRMRLYVPPNHPFAKRESVALEEAKNERFIGLYPTSVFNRYCTTLFNKAGFRPNIIAECDYTLRRELLRKGLGIVLSSDRINRVNYFDNCVAVLVNNDYAIRRMALFWAKNRKLSPTALVFRQFIAEFHKEQNSVSPN